MAVMQITAMNLTEPPPTDLPLLDDFQIQNLTADEQFELWSLTDDISGTAVFWGGGFLPPPPRPQFLISATEDGPTTCDLCTWAWNKSFVSGILPKVDIAKETTDEFGWFLTLIIVSIVSFIIGAFIMITFLHCRRLKNGDTTENIQNSSEQSTCDFQRPKSDKKQDFNSPKRPWLLSWLPLRKSSAKLTTPSANPAQNHYTHMNSAYSLNNEAAYAELDDSPVVARLNTGYEDFDENFRKKDHNMGEHAHSSINHAPIELKHSHGRGEHAYFDTGRLQNDLSPSHLGQFSHGGGRNDYNDIIDNNRTYSDISQRENTYSAVSEHAYSVADVASDQYCDADAPSTTYDTNTQSSAPSSAYYSDLSLSAQPDRTYEVIGVNNGYWDYQESLRDGRNANLGSINEILASDYV